MTKFDLNNPVTKKNVTKFIQTAGAINDRGIYLNRKLLKSLDIMNICFQQAKRYLGSDYNYIVEGDTATVRSYIATVFGNKSLLYFEDYMGEVYIDIEHALILLYNLQASNHPRIETAKGLLYFIAGHQLDDEFERLNSVITKDHIKPSLALEASLYGWRRCPYVLRKYISSLTIEEGYRSYNFEMPLFTHVAFLMVAENLSFKDAKEKVQHFKNGFFFTNLPIDVEEAIMPHILNGGFAHKTMDGYYKQALIEMERSIFKKFDFSYQYNVYNRKIKPIMVEIQGAFIGMLEQQLANTGLSKNDLFIELLSPQRLTIKLKSNLLIENVLQGHQIFKPTEPFNLEGLFVGTVVA